MSTPHQSTAVTVRDRVLDDLFRATVALCRTGSSLGHEADAVGRVLVDLDHAMRLLRDAPRLDAVVAVREPVLAYS